MFKNILLPLDGSPLAERATTYAKELARRTGATLELVQAVHTRRLPGVDPSDAQIELAEAAETYLDSVAGRVSGDGVGVTTHVCVGDPVSAILDAAHRLHVDLIVMSTHGRGGFGRMLYGSVADQILRRAAVPVLLVPSIVEHAWPAQGPLSLLIPLDGSELAEEALRSAELLSESGGARLTLLRVVQPPAYPLYGDGFAYVPYDEDADIAEARQYLDEQVGQLSARYDDVSSRIAVGEPTQLIGQIARELGADVVVMATHGASGLSRLIVGSVATGAVRHTTVPLLLIRPAVGSTVDAEPLAARTGDAGVPEGGEEAAASDDPPLRIALSSSELELIEHSLKALGFAPGYDYGHVVAARALADRLKAAVEAMARVPAMTR